MSRATKTCTHCGHDFGKDPRNTWAYFERAKYCSQKCAGEAWRQQANERRRPMSEEFAKWVSKDGECWLWTGALDRDGYGIFSYEKKSYRAPTIALKFDGRPVTKGHYACHHCDNPACVRPDHLYPGTPSQNSADAVRRGRNVRGERAHSAKLTDSQVIAIRAASGTHAEIAAAFGVAPSNVTMIRRRRTWKHLP